MTDFIFPILAGLLVAILIGVAVYCFMVYYNTDEKQAERSWTEPRSR